MKKLFKGTAAVFALILILMLAACGGNDYEEPEEAERGELWGETPDENEPAATPNIREGVEDELNEVLQAALRGASPETQELAAMVDQGIVVATINGAELTVTDMSFRIREAQFTLGPEQFELSQEEWERAILEEAVRLSSISVVFEIYAAQHGIFLTTEELDLMFADINGMIDWHGIDDFAEMVIMDGIYSVEHLHRLIHGFTLMDKVFDVIMNDPQKFAEFEPYMEPEIVMEDEEILAAKHILITHENFEDEDATMAFAREIWARAVAGEDFDALIAAYGEDPGMAMNPEGYTFTPGAMVPEFEQGTRELAIGEISEPISAFHGIHIILRVEPNLDGEIMRPWGQFVPTLEQRMEQAIFNGFEARAAAADIVFLPELYLVPVM